MSKPLNLRDVRYFAIVAEEENLHRASARLGVAQPALSRRIRDLEQTLEVALFERKDKRIRLTHAGKAFLGSARALLDEAEGAIEVTRSIARGEQGRLSIGMTDFAIRHRAVKQVIRWFYDSYPKVNIVFEPMTRKPLVKRVELGEVDFAFVSVLQGEKVHLPHIQVASEGFVVGVPASHPFAGQPHVELGDFHQNEIIWYHSRTSPAVTLGLKRILADSGIDVTFKPMFMTETAGLHLVSAGLGVSLFTSSLENPLPDSVCMKPLVGFDTRVDLFAMWHPETANPVVSHLLNGIRSMAISGGFAL